MVGYFDMDMSPLKGDSSPQDSMVVDCSMGPLVSSPNQGNTGERPDEPVKKVVCIPDLPAFTYNADSTETTPEKAYQCSFCQKTFGQKNTYQNHLRSHSKEGEDPYQCNICGKTFAVPARLTRHYRTHTGEKPYQCEYCNKSFSVKENLSVHRRIHTKERPYKCDICERAFEHSGKLHRHMRIHTGERPHKCSVCSKTFIQSGQLVIHMRTHTGEKPYVCKVCQKGFTCSKQLKVHTRTHTGEKPYTCEICGKSFGYNHVLKLHQVAHYGEKVYKCTICNETFTSKKTMEVHIKSHSDHNSINRMPPPQIESETSASSSDKENKMGDSDSEPPRTPSNSASECESEPPAPTTFASYHHQFPPMQELGKFANSSPPQQILQQQQLPSHQQAMQTQLRPNMRELCYYLYPHLDLQKEFQATLSYIPQQQQRAILVPANAPDPSPNGRLSPYPIRLFSSSQSAKENAEGGSAQKSDSVLIVDSQSANPQSLPVTEPSVSLCPEPLATMQRLQRLHTENSYMQFSPDYLEPPALIPIPLINKVHLPSLEPLTPPSSNPVSPAPSSSPDPDSGRETLVLPPRKRFLKHMEECEAEAPLSTVRYSSVIHYAEKGQS